MRATKNNMFLTLDIHKCNLTCVNNKSFFYPSLILIASFLMWQTPQKTKQSRDIYNAN